MLDQDPKTRPTVDKILEDDSLPLEDAEDSHFQVGSSLIHSSHWTAFTISTGKEIGENFISYNMNKRGRESVTEEENREGGR